MEKYFFRTRGGLPRIQKSYSQSLFQNPIRVFQYCKIIIKYLIRCIVTMWKDNTAKSFDNKKKYRNSLKYFFSHFF